MHSFTLISALAGASLVLAKPHAARAAAPHPLITPAPVARMVKPALERRQADNSDVCMTKAEAIFENAPPVDLGGPLATWLVEQADKIQTVAPNDFDAICSLQFPASIDGPAIIGSAYTAYLSESASWVSKVKPTVTSLAQSCGGAISAAIEMVLATDLDSCQTYYGAYMGAAESLATSLAGGFDDTTSSTRTGTTTVKPTETGTASDSDGDSNDDNNSGNDNGNDSEDAAATSSTSTAGAPRETGYVVAAAAAVVAVAGAVVAL